MKLPSFEIFTERTSFPFCTCSRWGVNILRKSLLQFWALKRGLTLAFLRSLCEIESQVANFFFLNLSTSLQRKWYSNSRW
jgi:hypothetical protein